MPARQTGTVKGDKGAKENEEVSGRIEVAEMSDPGFIFGFLLGALHGVPSPPGTSWTWTFPSPLTTPRCPSLLLLLLASSQLKINVSVCPHCRELLRVAVRDVCLVCVLACVCVCVCVYLQCMPKLSHCYFAAKARLLSRSPSLSRCAKRKTAVRDLPPALSYWDRSKSRLCLCVLCLPACVRVCV